VTRARSQQGAALVLVMWLVAAMAITVGGALALARDEVNLASARLGEAQTFVIGKGIARLAVLDRARARTATNDDGEVDQAALTRVFKAQYELDGFVLRQRSTLPRVSYRLRKQTRRCGSNCWPEWVHWMRAEPRPSRSRLLKQNWKPRLLAPAPRVVFSLIRATDRAVLGSMLSNYWGSRA